MSRARALAKKASPTPDPRIHYVKRVKPLLSRAPWILRVTEHKDKPSPVLIVKERLQSDNGQNNGASAQRGFLRERGLLYGTAQRRCLPVLRIILSQVCDEAGIPLGLEQFLKKGPISLRGNLPLDEEAGCKLALIFRMQERVADLDRVELIARRVERFTREEAVYWHSRTNNFGEAANRWALAGARIILGGQPGDPGIETMLEELRSHW